MRRHTLRRLFLTAALIATVFGGRTPANPIAPGADKPVSLIDVKPKWQVGDSWIVETANMRIHVADDRRAPCQGKPTRWLFAVSAVEKLDGLDCYRLDIRPQVTGRLQPKTTLWLDGGSLALKQFQTQLPVPGGFQTVTESYRFADDQLSPVMTPLVALPVDIPLFIAEHTKAADSFTYESVIGPSGQKEVGGMRFAFEIRQSFARSKANAKELLADDFAKQLDSQPAIEVKLQGFDRDVRQLWQPGLPWPAYADNGVSIARLVQFSPAR